jgi:ribonuclease HI
MYYAVHKGKKTGIFSSWNECKKSVDKYPNAIYKKFKNISMAKNFVVNGDLKLSIEKEDKMYLIPNQQTIKVYTDGSCIRNINNKHHGGYGVYFGKENKKNVSEPYIDKDVTNNRAELHAIQDAIRLLNTEILENKEIEIYTDSEYSLKSCTIWYKKWEKNGWKTKGGTLRKNIDYIQKLSKILENHKNIKLIHIKAHTGKTDPDSVGNDMADILADNGTIKSIIQSGESSELIIPFGKYKGKKLGFILQKPEYIDWVIKNKNQPYLIRHNTIINLIISLSEH